ncbi:hypothetical protein [Novosphingobium sp. NDB2Meth1]|uniref:hypothetical protein n=1 Tax=Novosphingobium sp. NDB2Meth1 TaxID=1892847 RepID=UPI000930665C|nr:hypothetical protein [Novosphingobium sp. NDB2Meth1]
MSFLVIVWFAAMVGSVGWTALSMIAVNALQPDPASSIGERLSRIGYAASGPLLIAALVMWMDFQP